MTDGTSWNGEPVDPLILQAEKILSQRLARNRVIDPDLLGEPGWDIMLMAFIETGKGCGCRADLVAGELGLSPQIADRWIGVLQDRGMLAIKGNLLVLTANAEETLRRLFSAQLKELIQEIAKHAPASRNQG